MCQCQTVKTANIFGLCDDMFYVFSTAHLLLVTIVMGIMSTSTIIVIKCHWYNMTSMTIIVFIAFISFIWYYMILSSVCICMYIHIYIYISLYIYLVGALEHLFFPYIGNNHPNRLMFFRGVEPQTIYIYMMYIHNCWTGSLSPATLRALLSVGVLSSHRSSQHKQNMKLYIYM